MKEIYMQSVGGGMLCCHLWEPVGEARAAVQIVHGIAEHTERYDEFARFLSSHGFLVAAEDHMGHGKSVGEGDIWGYFSGGWDAAVADSRNLQKMIQEQLPAAPCFLLGHSMGSFMARTMLFRYPDSGIRGAVLSGTGWQPAALLRAGLLLASLEEKRLGEKSVSQLLNNLAFGSYNRKFRPNRTNYDWLCTDEAVVDRYVADPMCGFDVTVGLIRDMLTGIREIQKPENLKKMNKDLPVLFFSGDQDPVGGMGKGVRRVAAAFKEAGMKQVSLKLYPGRHEMLNEKIKEQVFLDVLTWIERHIV